MFFPFGFISFNEINDLKCLTALQKELSEALGKLSLQGQMALSATPKPSIRGFWKTFRARYVLFPTTSTSKLLFLNTQYTCGFQTTSTPVVSRGRGCFSVGQTDGPPSPGPSKMGIEVPRAMFFGISQLSKYFSKFSYWNGSKILLLCNQIFFLVIGPVNSK